MTLFEYEDIRDFHLVREHWGCCSGGAPPGLESAVRTTLRADGPGLPNTVSPVRVVGIFRIEEIKEAESDIVWAIYALEDAEAWVLDR